MPRLVETEISAQFPDITGERIFKRSGSPRWYGAALQQGAESIAIEVKIFRLESEALCNPAEIVRRGVRLAGDLAVELLAVKAVLATEL